jgi:hypothetical protein
MFAIFSLLIIILLSILVVRIGTIALELTGLSTEIASFQAQSAFSGVGFTTSESEIIVAHPVRRRIVRILILLGSAGLTTSIATLVIAFIGDKGHDAFIKGSILCSGVLVLYLFARSKHIYVLMRKVIDRALRKWTTAHIFDYEQLLGLHEGYTISRIPVRHSSRLIEKKLHELRHELEGINVLAIYRRLHGKDIFIGGLNADSQVKAKDVLICYSHEDAAKSFAQRIKEEVK